MIETPFPDAVTVAHAVPLVHVPPSSRRQETRLVRIETRAAIPRCADGDMRAVSATIGGDPLHVDPDGGLWARLRVPVPGKRAQPLTPGRFLSFLRGEADPGCDQAILRSLTRTPLSPRGVGASQAIAAEVRRARGVEMPARGPGTVLHDGRERGGDDLAAFLGADIRVGDAGVYLRTAPLVRTGYGKARPFHVGPGRCFEPQVGDFPPMPDGGHAAACDRAFHGAWIPAEEHPSLDDLRAAGALAGGEAFEPVVLANVLPAYLVGQLESWKGAGSDRWLADDERRAVWADALRGMTGSVGHEDALMVIERASVGLSSLVERLAEFMEPRPVAVVAAHVRLNVLPRVRAAQPAPDEDAAALAALAP